MTLSIEEFHKEFFQEILAEADAEGKWFEDVFFEKFTDHMVGAGELETADRIAYAPTRGGIKVDGYGGDPISASGVLSLIIADVNQSPAITNLTATEMEAAFKRLQSFLVKSLDERFRNALEESDDGFGLADLIAKRWPSVGRVRLFLISNRILSSRVDGREAAEVDGVPVSYSVWDLGRLHRFAASTHGREEIVVDLEDDFGGAIPALRAHLTTADYESYLLVVPAQQLAAIYDRWGPRLLEQNVRVFLQARGSVNKGIRATLENDPEMFFAYNNGLTATAEQVETSPDKEGLVVTRLHNLQIVNGGQTTASIHAASRKKEVDLSRVFVQMKLSVVEPSRSVDVVPKISEYANSQNKVSAADFFANHPFHVRMEEFSRRIFAPSPDGTFRETKWFYERARGQYQDARALLTNAQRKKFDLEYPKAQLISKEDLAKYLNAWNGKPDLVSKGSQKSFAEFAKETGADWAKQSDVYNEVFYRHAVAKAILFNATGRLVGEQSWYKGGGLRSRVVPYAIAKVNHDATHRGRHINLNRIWQEQGVSEGLRSVLTVAAEAAHGVIAAPGVANPLEWAKQQACWNGVRELRVKWPDDWLDGFVSSAEHLDNQRAAVKDQRVLNGIEAQTAVLKAGTIFWKRTMDWALGKRLLSEKEASIFRLASSDSIPSEKQCAVLISALRKLHEEGYADGRQLF